jgi:hypothetical protein
VPGARSGVDRTSNVVPDLREPLPLVDEDRTGEACQNLRVGDDQFALA